MTKKTDMPVAPKGYTFIQSSSGISEYRLDANGLSVLLLEDHSAPVATFMVTYRVGSRNEALGYTGATHILEHLLFKGTKNFNKENGRELTLLLENKGGRVNASTWFDRTNYYELVPSEYLEDMIAVEADRMRNAIFTADDLKSEMTIVRNEFERGENDPLEALDKNIWATAYQAHPYHHSTIGWRSDIEHVSADRLREFYDTFYWPNNATVTVIGDIDSRNALELIATYFGVHQRSPHTIPGMYTTEPAQEGERRVTVRRAGESNIVAITYKMPAALHADTHALQVISKILGGGKSSRLSKLLIDKGLATDVTIAATPFRDAGLFGSYAYLTPGTSHEHIERVIRAEYEHLTKNLVAPSELIRAKQQIEADVVYSRDGSYAIAQNLNESIGVGDWTFYTTFIEKIRTVSAEDVRRAARTYFLESQSTIGYFSPIMKKNSSGAKRRHTAHSMSRRFISEAVGPCYYRAPELSDVPPAPAIEARPEIHLAAQVRESRPLPGITLLAATTGVEEVVSIVGSFLSGQMHSPANIMVPDILSDMLDQGTAKRSKESLRNALESVGASIEFVTSEFRTEFQVRCLAKDVPVVLSLLGEMLREPRLDPKDIEITKKRVIGQLQEEKENTRSAALRLFSQKIFPKKHPNYQLGIDQEITLVRRITRKDLTLFHKRSFGMGSLVVSAVGAVDEAVLSRSLAKAFKGWKHSPLELIPLREKGFTAATQTAYVMVPDKTSVDVYLGQSIGINRAHPDYYALALGVNILGLPGNFAARLMSAVREKQGLTYHISATIAGLEDGIDGYWDTYASFAPELLARGLEAIMEEVRFLDEKGVTAEELREKKDIFMGRYKTSLATTFGFAQTLLANAERDFPVSYLDELPRLIEKVTLEEVNAALKKYINPDTLAIVAAGSVDKNGKPLKK